jgi:DNA-binding transcriptional LysR family regulator
VSIVSAKTHRARRRPIDWDDLRFTLAVAREGSVAAAARAMSVNHSTVLRRIAAFEKRLGVRLFDRLPTGYAPTAGGKELIASAENMDQTATALQRKLAGRDLNLSGTVRVTTSDTLAGGRIPASWSSWRSRTPCSTWAGAMPTWPCGPASRLRTR